MKRGNEWGFENDVMDKVAWRSQMYGNVAECKRSDVNSESWFNSNNKVINWLQVNIKISKNFERIIINKKFFIIKFNEVIFFLIIFEN